MSVDNNLATALLVKARELNQQDPLAPLKEEFLLPENVVYLDGNSLGPLSKAAKARALEVVEQQWGNSLIASWNSHDWINLPKIVGNKIAKLIGASADTVICCDSISVNLFKLLSAALLLNNKQNISGEIKDNTRTIVLSQKDNFPTDLYMVQGLQELMNNNSNSQCELMSVASDEIENTIEVYGHRIAVLMLTHVNFRNGDIHDMQRLTHLAHEKGILVLWDLAHSAGVLPLALEECDVDFAVGCTYKYLNGGPGAPGFAYVAKRLLSQLQQPLSGWMGHKKPFEFAHDYEKARGIEQLLCGTPSIISMSVLDASLVIFEGLDLAVLREKSIALNCFFQYCIEQMTANSSSSKAPLLLACNKEASMRGSQISYQHPQAYAICQALISEGVISDFRAPDTLRIGFSPLFLSFTDMLKAAHILTNILQTQRYEDPQFHVKNAVT
ncbi:MAG: kynureninase [Alphaproteobacteria bacterium]|jgi:kynureninase